MPAADGSDEAVHVRRKLPKPKRMQTDEERETEDLSVAKFYEQAGNLQAAYLRSKDAVTLQPDDPEAHFLLAQVARRMNKRDEASKEYSTYLRLDADGDHVRTARKAIADLK